MYEEAEDIHPPVGGYDKDEFKLAQEKEKEELINKIQTILNGGHSIENENNLINVVQKQRKLLLDIATKTFISKPNNPKLMDSINTVLAQMEKSVRDDRKERLKDKELEDNKANFATFANALKEISAGKIKMPTFEDVPLNFNPLGDDFFVPLDLDDAIKPEELVKGRQILDSKKIEESFEIDPEAPIKLQPEEDEEEFDPES